MTKAMSGKEAQDAIAAERRERVAEMMQEELGDWFEENMHAARVQALGERKEALVALDWTDFDADNQTTLSMHLVSKHGRATPLQKRRGTRRGGPAYGRRFTIEESFRDIKDPRAVFDVGLAVRAAEAGQAAARIRADAVGAGRAVLAGVARALVDELLAARARVAAAGCGSA
jgi:hypothetical protein